MERNYCDDCAGRIGDIDWSFDDGALILCDLCGHAEKSVRALAPREFANG